MASSKRPLHNDDHERDGHGDCLPTQLRTISDMTIVEGIAHLEPLVRKIVREEIARLGLYPCAGESLGQTATPEGRRETFRLRFKELPSVIFTNRKIVAEDGTCLQVALYQYDSGGVGESIVGEGPLSCIEIELCILHGNLGSDGREVSGEEFRDSIIRQGRRGGQLLTGKTFLKLTNGVGSVTNLCVTDNSSWLRDRRFRLGAKVAKPIHDEANIVREGISQPFIVKDIRGAAYMKPDIPSMDDEIWRLKGIAKGGKVHKQLHLLGIVNVKDFLHQHHTNPDELKQKLGRFGKKKWENLIHQATEAYAKQDARQPHLSTVTPDTEYNTTTSSCVLQDGGYGPIHPSTQQSYLTAGPLRSEQELKITIKLQMESNENRRRALKLAAAVKGVTSVSEGDDDRLVVTGEGVDIDCLGSIMRQKFKHATILQVEVLKPEKDDKDKDKARNPVLRCYSPNCHCECKSCSKCEILNYHGDCNDFPMFIYESRKSLLLKLSRIRDFIWLLLNYPVRIEHDGKLKAWTHEASDSNQSLEDLNRLLNEKPLKFFEGLIPMEILENVEKGLSSIFADSYVIPEAILSLAVNLAVDQLVQTLLSEDDHVRDIHHVFLSTRDEAEKRLVTEKIEAVLKDKEVMLRLSETFLGVLLIDASVHQNEVEVHVRQQIAQQLQLPIEEGNDYLLKLSIEEEMSRKKYLVVLVQGDAEEPLDPWEVGFRKEELAGVVVLITTESSKQANDELTLAMDLNIKTKDHLLPWEVFYRNVDNDLLLLQSSNAIQTIAAAIVEECGSHLLAIVIVAKSLKNAKEHVEYWEHAIVKLRSPHPLYDISMFHGQSRVMVKAFINFIWHEISKTEKHCLTCCLFIPEIKHGKLEEELTNDWISSQLVVAGNAECILRKLVDRFALLQFKDTKFRYIQIPEDTYAILQSLNTLTPLFMKKSGLGLTEPPKDELWHSVVHMELTNNKLSELPLSPNSPELKELMLQGNVDLTRIPEMFFFKMPLLWILDLSYTSVRELPDSLFELEELKELYLKGCERVMKLSSKIGKLKKLEKLDLDGTQIIHLPKEIQELTNLQSLTLCFYEYRGKKSKQYTCSTIIPSEVISKLKGLKHLSIDVNPDDERWYKNVQDILPEILGLEELLTLSLYIPHLDLLKLLPAHIFEVDFRFIVGRHMQRIISSTPSTWETKFKKSDYSLKFVNGDDIPNEIKQLVGHSKALLLERHKTIKNLTEFKMMNLEQLRVCMLAECREMQTIVDGRMSNSADDIFSHLLYLYVSHMKSLRSLWEGPIPPLCFFGMLKFIALQNCPELTTVFTLDLLGNLSLLKKLIVKDCPKITTLISDGSFKYKGEIYLPKLKKILLLHLPKLINISNGCHIGPSLESMAIYNCPKLQSLSKMELSSQNLKVIKGETKWWDALQWGKEEWGMAYRPSMFDNIFSSINNHVDIMTQFGVDDDDIDDDPVNILKGASRDLTELDERGLPIMEMVDYSRFGLVNRSGGESRVDLKLSQVGNSGTESSGPKWKVAAAGGGDGGAGISKTALSAASGSPKRESCLVDGCSSDLSKCTAYYRHHKVCALHSKTPVVTCGGRKQRFCQQCSRFHSLEKFDDNKRSCRKLLQRHMERRRLQLVPLTRPATLFSKYQGRQILSSNSNVCPSSAVVNPGWEQPLLLGPSETTTAGPFSSVGESPPCTLSLLSSPALTHAPISLSQPLIRPHPR